MSIDFSPQRWDKIKKNARRWWAGELERPLIHITLNGCDPERPKPNVPPIDSTTPFNLSIPAEDFVDRWDYDLSCKKFLGDAFPHVWPDLGPGILETFLGAKAEPTPGTVWFHPEEIKDIANIKFEPEMDHVWLKRIRDICQAAMHRWHGLVQVGMTDLGGNLDISSAFRPSERLLFDLYDHPDEVKRTTWEGHKAWWHVYNEINEVLQPLNPGYTAWAPIFSEESYYMLQCDFCYMISPEMFNEFVKPELVASCKRLKNAFYHLDGPGQLPHLDSFLEIKELKGIQYVPTVQAKPASQYPKMYRKIREAGKLIQIYINYDPAGLRLLDILTDQLGSAKGIVLIGEMDISREKEAEAFLAKYDAL